MRKKNYWDLLILGFAVFLFSAGPVSGNPGKTILKIQLRDSIPADLPEGLFSVPKIYAAAKVQTPISIDGSLNDKGWENVAWSEIFSDIAGRSELKGVRIDSPEKILPTRIKMCWDDSSLYIAAKLRDPDLWATLHQADTIIYHNNDFEVFFTTGPDINGHYYEVEVNQLGTILDLLMTRPYRNDGKAMINFDMKGLKAAVRLQGTLNDPTDKDSGWAVEMAIPFKSVLAFGQSIPQTGAYWRMNFSRVQWDLTADRDGYHRKLSGGRVAPEHNWVWSPQGIVNMHAPDRWGYLFFTADSSTKPVLPLVELQKAALWKLYYRQQYTFATRQKFALTLGELAVTGKVILQNPVSGKPEHYFLHMQAGKRWFRVSLSDPLGNELLTLDQDGIISSSR